MIKKRRVRLLTFLTVMLLSMTVFSSVALADGSERTEPVETPQPTVAPTPVPTPSTQGSAFTNEGNMTLVDNLFAKNTNKPNTKTVTKQCTHSCFANSKGSVRICPNRSN